MNRMKLLHIYELMPIWLQNLMCSLQGYMICRRRYNKGFYKELKRYESAYYHQSTELVKMLLACKNMEIYQPYLKDVEWERLLDHPDRVYSVLSKFPIINKIDVKYNTEAYNNSSFEGKKIIMQTSGTTGGGLIFSYSVEMENRQWAIWWRYRRALGITPNTWCGWFGGKKIVSNNVSRPPYWRINRPGRQVMFSSYHLTLDTVAYYYNEIKQRKLEWLHGYPSHIARFAAYATNVGLEPLTGIRYVTTGAENVLGNQQEIMSRFFPNALIRQHYGLNEGVANISQDLSGEWNVDNDFCYVEFIPVSKENPNVCHIVGTGFSNLAFPLIRYDTGDIAEIVRLKDKMQVIRIDGRSSNAIKQPSGHDIVEASLSIVLHDFHNIVEAQFHQKSLTEIELWVVKGNAFTSEDERLLQKSLDDTFEEGVNCIVKYVEEVERTKTGKLKIVISEM